MGFTLGDGLAPEVYPLAWLVGTWRGPGVLAYPDIPERAIVTQASFDHDGGPYLTYSAITWVLDGQAPERDAPFDPDALPAGEVWARESGYWRTSATAAEPVRGAPAGGPEPTAIELVLAEPSGHVSVHVGAVQGPRIDLESDLVARTATAAEVTAQRRMCGLVAGQLLWALDLAAFGQTLQSYSSGRLARSAA